MKKYLIAYTFAEGQKGWITVSAHNLEEAQEYWYYMDIDGKAEYILEVV